MLYVEDFMPEDIRENFFNSEQLKSCGMQLQIIRHILYVLKRDIELYDNWESTKWPNDQEELDAIATYYGRINACALMTSCLGGVIAMLTDFDKKLVKEKADRQTHLHKR